MRHVQGRAGECHIVARTAKQDRVRELQRTLYRAAKADPGRRFHALHDKIYRRDVLERAWELVPANRGAAGIDRQTIADVEGYGVSRLHRLARFVGKRHKRGWGYGMKVVAYQ